MIESDREVLAERPPFDVPLRESLRLAAAWAESASPASDPSLPAAP
jgi:hypothetical protein